MFQIHALSADPFHRLFDLSDQELKAVGARRERVDAKPGTPCRVSLTDAEIGETVILLNYVHQPGDSPFRSSHAIYVRQGVPQAQPAVDEIPDCLGSRLLSIRGFNEVHDMVAADVVEGTELRGALEQTFSDPAVDYVHLHNAKPGCFAAWATRA